MLLSFTFATSHLICTCPRCIAWWALWGLAGGWPTVAGQAAFKPAAFYRGMLLPLCQSACTLRKATIIASVLAKTSIPVLHSSVALLKLAQLDYSGVNSLFIRCVPVPSLPAVKPKGCTAAHNSPMIDPVHSLSAECCSTRSTRCRTEYLTHSSATSGASRLHTLYLCKFYVSLPNCSNALIASYTMGGGVAVAQPRTQAEAQSQCCGTSRC